MRLILSLFLLLLPSAALADGMLIPSVALPAKITVPDQRALICLSNGTERLVIETRFTGSGTNFAWVVPLPSRPVIEEATTGLFPTLQYIFRPRITHYVPRYYVGILIFAGVILLVRLARRTAIDLVIYGLLTFVFLFLAGALLPVARLARIDAPVSGETVSVVDRKLVGVFETTTIASHDAKALRLWLSNNGYLVPTNLEPVITDYVKDGWIFVATKVQRDMPDTATSTPHPLSFTFKTDRPVYPMRLTGVDNGPLNVELYIFSAARATAPHFNVESCMRPNIVHPLLHQWTAGLPVVTKLLATLSPADMREDVWLKQAPFEEKESRMFSRQGALTIALNWGVGFFAAGLVVFGVLAFLSDSRINRFLPAAGVLSFISVLVTATIYLGLPKIEVNLVKGRYYYIASRVQQSSLALILEDGRWQTLAEARAVLRRATSSPTNAAEFGVNNWNNNWVGGLIREEDSPGNYLLRETNNQMEFVRIGNDGGEYPLKSWDLPTRH